MLTKIDLLCCMMYLMVSFYQPFFEFKTGLRLSIYIVAIKWTRTTLDYNISYD